MSEFIEKFLLPIVTGTAFGFIINWLLEWIRTNHRRDKILAALHAHLEALPRISTYNQTATNPPSPPPHLVPMLYPTIPFETAIFSENGISVSNETVQATIDYLMKATELNALIQALQSSHFASKQEPTIAAKSHFTRQFLYDQAKDNMPNIGESLKKKIEKEQNWLRQFKRFIKSRRK